MSLSVVTLLFIAHLVVMGINLAEIKVAILELNGQFKDHSILNHISRLNDNLEYLRYSIRNGFQDTNLYLDMLANQFKCFCPANELDN